MKKIKFMDDAINQENGTYKARGVDADGNLYDVFWDIINPDAEYDEDHCDWDSPKEILLIDKETLPDDIDIPNFDDIDEKLGHVFLPEDGQRMAETERLEEVKMKETKITAKIHVENQLNKHIGELEPGDSVSIEYGYWTENTIRRAIRACGFASKTDACGNMYAVQK